MDRKSNGAITLISLVITIIILLILATISIQSITQTGLFEGTNKSKLEDKRGKIAESLNLKLLEEQTKNYEKTEEEIVKATRENVETNKKELLAYGKDVKIKEIQNEQKDNKTNTFFYVIVDGDVYKVELSGAKFVGNVSEFTPIIKLKNISNTTNTISIEITTEYNEGGKLKYYIKQKDETEYNLLETTEEESYTYKNLIQNTEYDLKIEAIKNGMSAELLLQKVTGTVDGLTTENIKFKYEPTQEKWTNQNVTVTAVPQMDITGYRIRTSKDGKTWENKTSQIFEKNGTMYVELWDGTNEGKFLSTSITNIDKEKPTGTITTSSNSKSITVKVNAKDVEKTDINGCSGIKGYYYSINNGTSYTDSTTNDTYTFGGLAQGTKYNIKVKVEDNAGNVLELSAEQTTLTITLALDSTNGTVVDGASRTATISGANYGTLSAISNDTSVATASINGNILTVTGTITSGTKNAIITVSGSEGGTATYTVTAHRHTGNSSSGGGCYTNAIYGYGTSYCSGCTTKTETVYYNHECASKKCNGSFSLVDTQTSRSTHTYTNSAGKKKTCTRTITVKTYRCSTCGAGYDEENISHSTKCGTPEAILVPNKKHNSIGYCAGHKVTSTYCPGHSYSYISYYSRNCGF